MLLPLLCALREFSIFSRAPEAHAAAAIEVGAAAAWHTPAGRRSGDTAVHVLLPPEAPSADAFCELLEIAAGQSIVSCSDADELYEPHDWDLSSADPLSFRPQLIGRTLWVTPMLCDEELHRVPPPPSSALHLRLLDSQDGNVFLATTASTLHASTLMLLSLLVLHRHELQWQMLDYGCGSGILAIAALLLGRGNQLTAHATDVVDSALLCARRNARLNDIDDAQLKLYAPWELPSMRASSNARQADLAAANMLPGPLVSVAPELAGRVRTGGLLLLSGFRESDLAAVREAFGAHFKVPESPTLRQNGYIAMACRRTDAPLRMGDLSESAVS